MAKIIKQAFAKYGIENFTVELIQECNSIDELNNAERKHIADYKARYGQACYNIASGGNGGNTMLHATDEQKRRVAIKRGKSEHIAALRRWQNADYIAKQRASMTPERRKRQSLRAIQYNAIPENLANKKAKMQQRFSKQEERERSSKILKRHWNDADARAKHLASINRPEIKAIQSAAQKRRFSNPEERKRCSEHTIRCAIFSKTYGSACAYRYTEQTGKFAPWHSFIIVNDCVIAYVWDTREFAFACNVNELQSGYERTPDSHILLVNVPEQYILTKL